LKPTDRTGDLAGMKDWRKAALLYRNAVAIVYQVSALKLSTTGKEVESSAKETAPELYAESCTVVPSKPGSAGPS
jgi:hypothetical protein